MLQTTKRLLLSADGILIPSLRKYLDVGRKLFYIFYWTFSILLIMKRHIFILLSLFLSSFAILSFSNNSQHIQNTPRQFIVNKSLGSTWNKLQYFLFTENLLINSQIKIEGNASARIDLKALNFHIEKKRQT